MPFSQNSHVRAQPKSTSFRPPFDHSLPHSPGKKLSTNRPMFYSKLSLARPSDFQQDCKATHESSDRNYYKSVESLKKFFCPNGSLVKEINNPRVEEFLELVSSGNQISFDSIGSKCMQIYEEEKAKMKETLKRFDGQISLAVDILRSGKHYNPCSEYLCLTAFFVDDNWNLQKWTLSFGLIGSEWGGAPHDIIIKSLKDWDIEKKVNSITMVNCEHCEQTLQVIKDHIHRLKALPLDGLLFKLNCVADIVNQMVQSAYGKISPIFDKISKLYDFKDVASQTWKIRSTLLKDSFQYRVFCSSELLHALGLPKDKEWEKVSDVVDLVDDIYDIIHVPFEMGNQTANTFLPHLEELQMCLTEKSRNSNGFTKKVAKTMLQMFKEYMTRTYLVFAVAAVMDPRFKMRYLEFSSPEIKGDYVDIKAGTVLALSDIYNDYIIRFPIKEKPKVNSPYRGINTSGHREPPACVELATKLEGIHICDEWVGLNLLKYTESMSSTSQAEKSELERYLEEPVIPWCKNFDTFGWWKASRSRFPILSLMARDLIAIPGCVAVGDEATLMKQRKADYCVISAGPELMNAFMCVRNWFLKK